jgi:hypothetical protein
MKFLSAALFTTLLSFSVVPAGYSQAVDNETFDVEVNDTPARAFFMGWCTRR